MCLLAAAAPLPGCFTGADARQSPSEPSPFTGDTATHWTVTDSTTHEVLGQDCELGSLPRPFEFFGSPGQTVELTVTVEVVYWPIHNYDAKRCPDACHCAPDIAHVEQTTSDDPVCWTSTHDKNEGCLERDFHVLEVLASETIPADARHAGSCVFRGDGYRATMRVHDTGDACFGYNGVGAARRFLVDER